MSLLSDKCLIKTKRKAKKELMVTLMSFEMLVGQGLRPGDSSECRAHLGG